MYNDITRRELPNSGLDNGKSEKPAFYETIARHATSARGAYVRTRLSVQYNNNNNNTTCALARAARRRSPFVFRNRDSVKDGVRNVTGLLCTAPARRRRGRPVRNARRRRVDAR